MRQAGTHAVYVLYVVSLSAFFASLNQNIYSPVIPLVRDVFDVSLHSVNLTVSLFIFITAVMQLIFGPLIDLKGARKVLIPGILLAIGASIGCALTSNFVLFTIFRSLQAVGTAAVPVIAAAAIGQLFTGSERGRAMATYQMLLSVAPAIAPVIGGVVGGAWGYSGIFWFLAGTSVLLLAMNLLFFPKDKPAAARSLNLHTMINHYRSIMRNRTGGAVLTLGFLAFLIYFAVLVYLPVVLTDHYRLSLALVGLLYVPAAGSTVAGSLLFKYLQTRRPLPQLCWLFNAGLALASAGFALTHSWTLAGMSAALVVIGICIGALSPLYATMMAGEFEDSRASAIGGYNFVRYIGMAAGPVLLSWCLAIISPLEFFLGLGLLLGVVFMLWLRLLQAGSSKSAEGVDLSRS
ncbi:MFS transporter [Paenibacillus sambharensis]|uniref:MFS transporter n=1 Tax=Paenibacillus sambharensis TaxID=1803190 RepID=A0A2W1LVZ2_9BACL|nr:MFS transporter [Paenibacillus sambharensis]PZD95677.1 MFS transporter [Paenibacillus sambharensis]